MSLYSIVSLAEYESISTIINLQLGYPRTDENNYCADSYLPDADSMKHPSRDVYKILLDDVTAEQISNPTELDNSWQPTDTPIT